MGVHSYGRTCKGIWLWKCMSQKLLPVIWHQNPHGKYAHRYCDIARQLQLWDNILDPVRMKCYCFLLNPHRLYSSSVNVGGRWWCVSSLVVKWHTSFSWLHWSFCAGIHVSVIICDWLFCWVFPDHFSPLGFVVPRVFPWGNVDSPSITNSRITHSSSLSVVCSLVEWCRTRDFTWTGGQSTF